MLAKIALNVRGLSPRQTTGKIKAAVNKLTGNASFTTPTPSLQTVQANIEATEAKLDQIETKERELITLRLERDQLLGVNIADYTGLAGYVQDKAAGDAAKITDAGFDLAGQRTAPQPMPKLENHFLTSGDDPGTADAGCNSAKGAKSYEWQTSADGVSGWTHRKTTTRSKASFTGLPSGQRIWSRVRAINSLGEGPWSDPATTMIP